MYNHPNSPAPARRFQQLLLEVGYIKARDYFHSLDEDTRIKLEDQGLVDQAFEAASKAYSADLVKIVGCVSNHQVCLIPQASNLSYTIGLWDSFGVPELVFSGVPKDVALQLAKAVADAPREVQFDELLPGPQSGRVFLPKPLNPKYLPKLRLMCWYYCGCTEVAVVQAVASDSAGKFPWNKGYSSPKQLKLYQTHDVLEKMYRGF